MSCKSEELLRWLTRLANATLLFYYVLTSGYDTCQLRCLQVDYDEGRLISGKLSPNSYADSLHNQRKSNYPPIFLQVPGW